MKKLLTYIGITLCTLLMGGGIAYAFVFGVTIPQSTAPGQTIVATTSGNYTWTNQVLFSTTTGNFSAPLFTANSTTVSSIFPRLRNGEVLLMHRDGSSQAFLAAADTDTARGDALYTALGNVLENYDSIYVSGGVFDLGIRYIDLNAGFTYNISLHGAGKYKTIIKSTAFSNHNDFSCIVIPANNSEVTDLTIQASASITSFFQCPYGEPGGGPEDGVAISTTSPAILRNVRLIGNTDGFYDQQSAETTIIGYNVDVTSAWDSVFMAGADASSITLYDSTLSSTASTTVVYPSTGVHAVTLSAGTFNAYNTKINSVSTSTQSVGILTASTGIASISGGSVTASTTSGTALALSRTAGTISVSSDVVYDPTKTSGTITYVDNPQLRYSLGSNGASSTVLWNNNGIAAWVATSSLGISGGGSSLAWMFALAGNATSTLTQFNGGLTAYASSTIGAGGVTTGLTISGNSTTTGAIIQTGSATSTFAGPLQVGTATANATSTVTIGDVSQSTAGCINIVTHSGGVYATSSLYMIGATIIGEANACK